MSYSFVSHGGSARTSTLIVDSDIDMDGFSVSGAGELQADSIKSHNVVADNSIYSPEIQSELVRANLYRARIWEIIPSATVQATGTSEVSTHSGGWLDAFSFNAPAFTEEPIAYLKDLKIRVGISVGRSDVGWGAALSMRIVDSGGNPVSPVVSVDEPDSGYVPLTVDTYTLEPGQQLIIQLASAHITHEFAYKSPYVAYSINAGAFTTQAAETQTPIAPVITTL